MKKFLLSSFACTTFLSFTIAQVGINTETPKSALDVNGSIQLRDELRVNGNPGVEGQVYFSDGIIDDPQWKPVKISFLETGQYQLVNTYAKKDSKGIDWVGTFGGCVVDTFPFTETFETNSTSRSCWTNEYVAGTTDWTYAQGDGGNNSNPNGAVRNTAHGGSSNARFTSTSGQTTKLVSPVFNLSKLGSPRLTFWYGQRKAANPSTNQNQLKIYYRTSSDAAWVQILPSYTGSITAWTSPTAITLPNPSATYQIAFEGISNGGRANVIDDVTIDEGNACIIKTFPFTETFEENSATKDCWTNVYVVPASNGANWTRATGDGGANQNPNGNVRNTAHGGTLNARFTETNNRTTKWVSPVFDLTYVTNPALSFWYGQRATSGGAQNQLKVYYRTSPSGGWTQIGSTLASSITAWTQVTINLPNKSATYQIAFEGISNGGRANVLDDVTIYDAPFFFESFESDPTARGWSNIHVNGNQDWVYVTNGTGYGVGPGSPHSGSQNAKFVDSPLPAGQITKLVTPALDISGLTNPKVRFYYAQPYWSGDDAQNELRIYYRTSPTSEWVLINEYLSDITAWTEEVLSLPNPSATYQVAFEAYNEYGYPNVLDDVEIYGDAVSNGGGSTESYDSSTSDIGELITLKTWRRIPGLDTDFTITSANNKISVIFQTGAESRLDPGNNTTAQSTGDIKYTCGVFEKLQSEPDSAFRLAAVRADQVNNITGKQNQNKSQGIFTLVYTIEDGMVPGDYTFGVACRRLSRSSGGGGTEATSLFSIGNRVDTGNEFANDFMLQSILKVDVIELVNIVVP